MSEDDVKLVVAVVLVAVWVLLIPRIRNVLERRGGHATELGLIDAVESTFDAVGEAETRLVGSVPDAGLAAAKWLGRTPLGRWISSILTEILWMVGWATAWLLVLFLYVAAVTLLADLLLRPGAPPDIFIRPLPQSFWWTLGGAVGATVLLASLMRLLRPVGVPVSDIARRTITLAAVPAVVVVSRLMAD